MVLDAVGRPFFKTGLPDPDKAWDKAATILVEDFNMKKTPTPEQMQRMGFMLEERDNT
jgi:hypothetical protein